MAKEGDTVLYYMSERLKSEPYISKPNSKLFLAEVATVIFHILQEDGRFNLHIDKCLEDFKNSIFDFSIKIVATTRNFSYFTHKNDTDLSAIFHNMLDDFGIKEIRTIMQCFDKVESIDDDYNIIFKEKTDYSDLSINRQETIEEPFVINRQTKEEDIIIYFNKKIKEGYYTDIYKLLVDFSMMMYRKGALSIDLSFPKFNGIIKYINEQFISKFWFHQFSSEQLVSKFTYCWKNTKWNIIKKAADALKIPYQITGKRRLNNQQIKLVEEKESHHNTEENIVVITVRETIPIKEETKEEENKTEEEVIEATESKKQDDFIIPYVYSGEDVESKLSELFVASETILLDEEVLLQEINILLCSHAWENIYDLFGDIQYIIYNQKRLATYINRTVNYKNVKLSQLEGRHALFLRTFPKKLKLDTRQNSRKSYRDVWHNNYAVSTIEKMGMLFEPIKSIDISGKILLKPIYVSASRIIVDTTLKQQHSQDDVFEYIDLLSIMYDISQKIFIQESDIIFIHRRIAEKREWENPSKCIASIAYILIRQIGLNSNNKKEQYKLLNNLYRKSIVLNAKYNLIFKDNNHEHNISKTLGLFMREYNEELITDFYNSLIGICMPDNNIPQLNTNTDTKDSDDEEEKKENHIQTDASSSVIPDTVFHTEKKSYIPKADYLNTILLEQYNESESFILDEREIVELHRELAFVGEWNDASQCIASIAYIIIRQIELVNSPRGLRFLLLRYLFNKCIVIQARENLDFKDGQHAHNIAIVRERFVQRYGIKTLVDFYKSIIGLSNVADDGTIILEEPDNEHILNLIVDNHQEQVSSTDNTNVGGHSNEETATISADEIEEDEEDLDEELEETEEEEISEEEESVLDEDEETEEVINDTPVKITFNCETRAEKELSDFWNSTFKDGYIDTYIWKNKISTETYGELKEKLKICVNDKQKEKGFPKRFAKAIVVYCAEWYKREYNGNDGKGNPLDAIGIKQLRSLDLWEWADIDKKLLFGNEYLESIYTLGGFPIFYITSKKVDDILKELNSTYNDNTSNDSAKKRIFDKNKTLQYSLRKENGSLHLLFDYIKDPEHYPIADTDLDKDPFKKFIEGIQNFRKKWDKFSLDWIVECNEYAPLIRRKIRLKLNPEENGIHNNRIPYYRVEKFQEEKDIDIYLCFNDEDTEDLENREHIHFINTFNGYFVGESVIDYYIFSEIPTIDIDQIRVVAKHVDNEKSSNHDFVEIQVEQNIKPYLQLFETGKYSTYSTKRNQGDSYLLLPFNYPIVKGAINQDASPKYLTENGIKYRFTKIIDQLIITDLDGKVIPVYSQNNKIEVSIEKYSNIFVYQNENYFTRVVTDESGEETSSPVQLLFKKSDIKCTQYFDVTEPRDLEDDEVIIKFKKENDTFYSDWTENNQPEKGFIKLRVDVQDKKIHLDVYYIPSNEIPFKRDCISNKIVIGDSVNIVESTSYDLKSYRDKYECLFKVGSTNDYVIIPIVKPLNITELYKDGEFIKEYKNESEQHIRIPLLFKDKYSIRRYDESGMAYHELANEDIDILDFKFEDDCSSIEKTIERSTPVGNIEFYLCTTKKYIETSEGYKLNVGEIGADNYIFYFWDMNLNHKPNRINGTYEDGLLNLHSKDYPNGIIFQSLEENVCPRHYYKPILTTYNKEWPKDSESLPTCLKCFDIASKHNIPYRVFKPLYWLLKDTDSRLIHFFACLILRHWDDENDELLLSNLVRLSQELYFSWPFLNIKVWKQYKDEYIKLREDNEERISSINKEIFEEKFLKEAKRLFLIYAKITNQSSFLSMEKFANIYWNVNKTSLSQFISSYDYKWFTYDKIFDSSKGKKKIKWNSLASKALILMRARPLNNQVNYPRNDGKDGDLPFTPDIDGFTDYENYDRRSRVDNIRDIGKICSFLKLLYEDDNSYSNIIRFFTYYGIIK